MVTYLTAQYRHVVVCSGLYPVRSQSLHGGYSSGCFESAMQPSSTEKSSRTTLHYVIQNDSARDLVLPPLDPYKSCQYHNKNSKLGCLSQACVTHSPHAHNQELMSAAKRREGASNYRTC